MSTLKMPTTVKKYKRIIKNVINKKTDSSHKYKINSGNTRRQRMSSLKKPTKVKKSKRNSENVITKEASNSKKNPKKTAETQAHRECHY